MSWIWIILIVIAYILVWAAVTAAFRYLDRDLDYYGVIGSVVMGFLWPVVFLGSFIYHLSDIVYKEMIKEKEK